MKRDSFLVFGSPRIEEEEIAEVVAALRSGWIGTGPRVAQFERAFAAYKEVEHVAAVSSCTAALHLSLLALGLTPGAEVITSALTFCATVNAIIHAGGTPVLVDLDESTQNLDPEAVERAITPRTRAIVPVHFAGRPCDMDALARISNKHGLAVVEDCAHAIETEYKGKKAGTFGDFSCFSFYVTKNIVTGEGGMVVAKSPEEIARIKVLALHGMTKDAWLRFGDQGYKHYGVVGAGYKYNMMDIQAALGIHQVRRIEAYWLRRKEIWQAYQEAFADLPITRPSDPDPDTRHALHLYTIRVNERSAGIARDRFLDEMTDLNIGVGVHYLSLAEHQYYQDRFGWRPEQTPNAMKIGRETVSLPISAKLTNDDVADVIVAVRQTLGAR